MRDYEQIVADAATERPFSNGTEFEMWADSPRGCWNCVNDDDETERYCPILSASIALGVWPKEWTRREHRWQVGDKSGAYDVVDACTEFEERRDDDGGDPEPEPGPPPVLPGQLDIFAAFADQIIEQASREQVPA